MNAVITKNEKNKIKILGAITAGFGAVVGSIGLYLRAQLTTSGSWEGRWIPQYTNGYFGVMSGFSLFFLGTIGYSLVYSRLAYLVFVYGLFSLSCDVLCVFDALMVIPYTKDYGRFAWDEQECRTFNATTNSTIIINPNPITESCADIKIIAILLICITTVVLVVFLLSTVITAITGVALCRAKSIPAAEQSRIELAPFSTPKHFQPTSYNNTVYQTDGYKK